MILKIFRELVKIGECLPNFNLNGFQNFYENSTERQSNKGN